MPPRSSSRKKTLTGNESPATLAFHQALDAQAHSAEPETAVDSFPPAPEPMAAEPPKSRKTSTASRTAQPSSADETSANHLSVGERLRRQREALGLTIDNVMQMLKIRRVYLVAIENSAWDQLPEPVYVSGFIRSYSNFLGLQISPDDPSLAPLWANSTVGNAAAAPRTAAPHAPELYEPPVPALPKPVNLPALVMPKPLEDQQLPNGRMLVACLVGMFILYAFWTAWHSDGSQDKSATTPPAPIAANETPTPAMSSAPALISDNLPTTPPPETTPPTAQRTATVDEPALPTTAQINSSTLPAPTVYGAEGTSRVIISATRDSWVQIRTRDGQVAFSTILRQGDSYRVPDNQELYLASTNLAALSFSLDNNSGIQPPAGVDTLKEAISLSPNNFLKTASPEVAAITPDTAQPSRASSATKPSAPRPQARKVPARKAAEESEDSTANDDRDAPYQSRTYEYPSDR